MASSGIQDGRIHTVSLKRPQKKRAKKKVNTAVLALLITSCINRGKKKKRDKGDFCANYPENEAA